MERKGKLGDLDRSFDLVYWQAQSPQARFDAAWELIVHYARVKGLDVHQLSSDLLRHFNDNGVSYLLIGGYAVIQHGEPRWIFAPEQVQWRY